MKIYVPPIKSQGIKTKLIPWISSTVPRRFAGTWIEPFMDTGAVAFNLAPDVAVLCDTNPHLIKFYQSIADGEVTPKVVRDFLSREGARLLDKGESHYYHIRDQRSPSAVGFLIPQQGRLQRHDQVQPERGVQRPLLSQDTKIRAGLHNKNSKSGLLRCAPA